MFSIFGSNELSPIRMHFITWNVFLNFYLTHFEKYNTGVLYLPHAYDFTMWVSFSNISRSNEIIVYIGVTFISNSFQGVTIVLMITGA